MPDPDDIRDAPSITPAFAACLMVYRHLCLSLTRPDCRVADQVDVPKVCDNYGRLNVWGSDSGALRTGRGSLDDVLRTNEILRSIVLDTISDLTKSIKRATLLADVGPTINEEHLLAGDSDGDSLSSASTTSESLPNGGNISRSKKGEIHYSFSDIFIHIQSLYKISVSLRRPAVHDKYIRSVSKNTNTSYFFRWDYSHVEIKFQNASEVLVRRLALANTRRRQQLKYWEKHPQDAAEGVLSEAALFDTATPPKNLAIGRPAKESNPTQSLGIPSRATKQSFSTVARSIINDNETFSGRPKTLYEPSLQGAGGYLRVPDIPAVPFGRTSFECPYCRTHLDVKTMRKRQLWKKHVFRDLRPYVCTYEGCLNAEKLYVTRHDWMYHEGQLHQRSWICENQCNRKFSTPRLLKEHMLDCHLGTFAESQLPILVDMCERPADPNERASCPLCGMEATLRALRTHVASHLEDLALFVLPVETNDGDADSHSNHAEVSHEEDSRIDEDETSSLGSFGEEEEVQSPLRGPKAFERALKKEGDYPLSEPRDWPTNDLEVRSEEEEEREFIVQADLDADIEAKRRRESRSPAVVPIQPLRPPHRALTLRQTPIVILQSSEEDEGESSSPQEANREHIRRTRSLSQIRYHAEKENIRLRELGQERDRQERARRRSIIEENEARERAKRTRLNLRRERRREIEEQRERQREVNEQRERKKQIREERRDLREKEDRERLREANYARQLYERDVERYRADRERLTEANYARRLHDFERHRDVERHRADRERLREANYARYLHKRDVERHRADRTRLSQLHVEENRQANTSFSGRLKRPHPQQLRRRSL